MTTNLRLLDVARLSNLTDETTSPARQHEQNNGYAALYGHTVVATIEDLDVSGSVSPFDREELGPWLTDPHKIAQWDGIIVAKLDRLTRSLLHFQSVKQWCDQNGKVIISVAEGFDLSTPVGRLIANILVMFAEFERERMGERRREAAVTLRREKRWGGGTPPFGYKPKKNGNGLILVRDEEYAPILEWMADQVLAGMSCNALAIELNNREVPTQRNITRIRGGKPPRDEHWVQAHVHRLLHSPSMTGVLEHKGKIVHGPAGEPVMRAEPLIGMDKWRQLQDALDKRRHNTSGQRSNASMLLRVAYCTQCDGTYYTKPSGQYLYYVCAGKHNGALGKTGKTCPAKSVRQAVFEEVIEGAFLAAFGSLERHERIVHTVRDNTVRIAEIDDAIREMRDDREAGLYRGETGTADYRRRMTRLETERQELDRKPREGGGVEWVATGQQIADYWDGLSREEKGTALRQAGVRVEVHPDGEFGFEWGAFRDMAKAIGATPVEAAKVIHPASGFYHKMLTYSRLSR